jgi:hypothetical protein
MLPHGAIALRRDSKFFLLLFTQCTPKAHRPRSSPLTPSGVGAVQSASPERIVSIKDGTAMAMMMKRRRRPPVALYVLLLIIALAGLFRVMASPSFALAPCPRYRVLTLSLPLLVLPRATKDLHAATESSVCTECISLRNALRGSSQGWERRGSAVKKEEGMSDAPRYQGNFPDEWAA